MARPLMVVGTASHVGKSVIATALCRILYQEGYRVAPFKAQNMSLNSAVTPSGREIGRAQAAQAEACDVVPNEHMNPVLLKPTRDNVSQIVVQGRVWGDSSAVEYGQRTDTLWSYVTESYEYLAKRFDLLVMEGAGSPVELNLKPRDIANMRMALHANANVVLVADIDRGGVFASVVGTLSLMTEAERACVRGVIVNRFRGNPTLFEDGRRILEELTGIPVIGVVPYIQNLYIDEEDGVAIERSNVVITPRIQDVPMLQIAVIQLPHISNFTDLDPLFLEPDLHVFYATLPKDLANAHAIILPGTKNTMEDAAWLHTTGLGDSILQAAARGVQIFGICGGYQMLGRVVRDPHHVEASFDEIRGLNQLPIETTMLQEKQTHLVEGQLIAPFQNVSVNGYEIHMGSTVLDEGASPFAQRLDGSVDGAMANGGDVVGTYLHGIFHNDDFRSRWLNRLRVKHGMAQRPIATSLQFVRAAEYDRLADVVRANIDVDAIRSWL